MKEPKFTTPMESLHSDLMGVCPNCGKESKLVLCKMNETEYLDYLIESRDVHQGYVTNPFQFSCSTCGSPIGIKFRIDSIIKYEQSFLSFNPPPERTVRKVVHEREQTAKRERALRANGVGTTDDQDDTEQGRV